MTESLKQTNLECVAFGEGGDAGSQQAHRRAVEFGAAQAVRGRAKNAARVARGFGQMNLPADDREIGAFEFYADGLSDRALAFERLGKFTRLNAQDVDEPLSVVERNHEARRAIALLRGRRCS